MTPLHLLALVGVTIILTRGVIFKKVRAIYPDLLACPMCMGFWVGGWGALSDGLSLKEVLFTAPLVSLLSTLTDLVFQKLGGPPDHGV